LMSKLTAGGGAEGRGWLEEYFLTGLVSWSGWSGDGLAKLSLELREV